ncbi:MAG: PAM68 family protein [Microcystaceae cyanobacterium]
MPSSSSRGSLPFEPRSKKNKKRSQTAESSPQPTNQASQAVKDPDSASLQAIPEVVSRRMVKRMALFCGIPSALGMSSFVISYLIVSRGWFDLPTYVVLAVSFGLFGLGVLGLSYGIFSTSWEEDRVGGWWGWQEFTLNLGRTVNAWRSERQKARES